jgi:hypothetical protein
VISKHSWRLDEVGQPAAATRHSWARLASLLCLAAVWEVQRPGSEELATTRVWPLPGCQWLLLGRRVYACGGDVRRWGRGRDLTATGERKTACGSTNLIFWKSIMGYYWRWPLFFLLHNYLGVGKYHVLGNKICQTLGDALSNDISS